jgi:hypothetical protein
MGEALLGRFTGDSVVAHLVNLRQGAKKTLTWTKGRELKTLAWNFQKLRTAYMKYSSHAT